MEISLRKFKKKIENIGSKNIGTDLMTHSVLSKISPTLRKFKNFKLFIYVKLSSMTNLVSKTNFTKMRKNLKKRQI